MIYKQEFRLDTNNQEILLRENHLQVMMKWEKPYMEACIDQLKPKGDVLEIGFGCGYSATRIQKYKPKSHTIIECHPVVIERLKEWSKQYKNINIVEGMWQEKLKTLGIFDEIFFDDFPTEKPMNMFEKKVQHERFYMFVDICHDWHMRDGSKLSAFMASGESKYNDRRFRDTIINNSKFNYIERIIDVDVPDNCDYFTGKKAVIPIIERTKNTGIN